MNETMNGFSEAEFEKRVQPLIVWARENFSFEQAIRAFAIHKAAADCLLDDAYASAKDHQETGKLLAQGSSSLSDGAKALLDTSTELYRFIPRAIQIGVISEKRKASNRGKLAANALHKKPGGSRSKVDEIRRIWATGKYRARSRCAEEECAALGMSYDTARKALRNTPNP